ncbi:TSUP family transporter [Vibrio quintilis]|uniref:Probable membrane transporter protein n=1 Tax=Vibrio quintilis TaxID=1117707 RepID=A0A1M7Z2Y5_9VIBR|nr:TSUP family transporter [Vibrio quintilis]SHO59317.1 hypothetical protein VQ7734_05101 [Vibrio quintilis]
MEYVSLLNSGDGIYLFLFVISVIAGIVDAIAGGGGLITVPALLLAGLPPMAVLGTNRLQAVVGELTTSVIFLSGQSLPRKGLMTGIICASAGALAGSFAVSLIDKESMEILLPVLMCAITLYSVLSKQLKSVTAAQPKISSSRFMVWCGLLIGFYNGFFGPGTGSLWMIAFVILLGYTIRQASMMTKPLNLAGNLVSLILFIILGHVDYTLGIVMGVGQIAGSLAGSRFVISHGHRIVRPVFISVTMLMTAKLIYEHLWAVSLV